jgi:predicted ribosome quality control (RQC) complex YloA/Tae2 family protein
MPLRKEFTSFDVAVAVRELKEAILESRVNNIYQLDNRTLFFKLHKPDEPAQGLILEAGRRLHLTSYIVEKPSVPPAFCMALRKYLRNARLASLEQYEFERVVVFSFKTNAGDLRLVLELFGDGNVILIGEDNRILQALGYKRMRDRNILRHEVFRFAPASGRNPMNITREELLEELKSSGETEVVRVLARRVSVGGTYAEETLLRAKIDKSKKCSALSQAEIDAIFEVLRSLLAQASEGILEPLIVLNAEEDFVDVVPFRLRRYENIGLKFRPCRSFNEALDEFYVRLSSVERALAGLEVDQLGSEVERLKRIITDQQNALDESDTSIARNKSIGDVIYAHSAEIQALMDKFSVDKLKGKKLEAAVSEALGEKKAVFESGIFFESFDSKTSTVNVSVDGTRFGLNLRMSLFENAAEYYERSKRAKQKLEGARAALRETRRKLAEVEAKIGKAEALGRTEPANIMEEMARHKVKRKNWFEKFRWFVSSDGFLVVAGKDAVSNEVLIKKHSEPEDVVFHAEIVGAPFVVVKTNSKQPSEQVLNEASEFAAAFSRAWQQGFASIDVYWVKPDQLRKSGPSGQYVPHGAFAVIGKRDWKRNVPLRVAVGVLVEEEGAATFIGGPVDSVKTRTPIYTVIVQGSFSGKRLLEYILKTLAEKMPTDLRHAVLKASIEDIRGFIPYNIGKVLES